MSRRWFYRLMGEVVGPISSAELVDVAKRGVIQPDTPVQAEGKSAWLPAERVKGLFPTATTVPAAAPTTTPPVPASAAPLSPGERGRGEGDAHDKSAPPAPQHVPAAESQQAPPPASQSVDFNPSGASSKSSHYRIAGAERAAPASENGDADQSTSSAAEEGREFEFFDFVGFDEAISHALHAELVRYADEKGLTITQVTRRALAQYLGKPELAEPAKPAVATTESASPPPEASPSHSDAEQGIGESSSAPE